MNKNMNQGNQNLGNTGGNLDNQGVRSNIGKTGGQTGGTDFGKSSKLGVDKQDINR